MYKHLYDFLELRNILCSFHFGFRGCHSINHALISLKESVKNSLDSKKFGCGIFLDLQKAFDTVNRQILLKKLENYVTRGIALSWFCSYLSNREEYVPVKGHNSCNQRVTCGVPQGSVLGPLLFLIYINDISKASSKLSFYLFADDTNIYNESGNLEQLQKVVNNE